jgi:class 3 adenylate cyclase
VNAQSDAKTIATPPDAAAEPARAVSEPAGTSPPPPEPTPAAKPSSGAPLRSVVGAIVYADIVDFAKKPVAEQLAVKDRFASMLSASLQPIDADERLVLDTGDGAALTFLGDIDDALHVAMRMRDYLRDAGGAPAPGASEGDKTVPIVPYAIRTALNIGPLKLVRDAHGHPNIVGDGVSVAQRIVTFAEPGQILASRSFCKDVYRLSATYKPLFSFQGARTDQHVREHELYVVGEAKKPLAELFNKGSRVPPKRSGGSSSTGAGTESNASTSMGWFAENRSLAYTGAALAVLVLGLLLALAWRKPAKTPPVVASTPVSSETPASRTPSASLPPASDPTKTIANTQQPVSVAETPASTAPVDATKTLEEKKPAPRPVQGTVNFSIQPWGTVYVNGKSIGASPPLKQTRLTPGKYKIEVRNVETFAPYIVNIEVKAREEVSVRHKF